MNSLGRITIVSVLSSSLLVGWMGGSIFTQTTVVEAGLSILALALIMSLGVSNKNQKLAVSIMVVLMSTGGFLLANLTRPKRGLHLHKQNKVLVYGQIVSWEMLV